VRILVTGGGGFIGSHLTARLIERGDDVRLLDNFATGRRSNMAALPGEFELIEGDIQSYERVHKAVRDCEVVFHQAALPSVPRSIQDPLTSNATNVIGTLNVLLAARDEGVRRVVYASSSSVYGQAETLPTPESARPRPMSPYGVTKLTAEHLCDLYAANFGLSTVALRYFSVYGPGQRPDMAFHRFFRAALEGTAIEVYGDGSQTRDFTFVGDVVAATKAAAQRPAAVGGVFNIGAGSRVTLNETLRLVGELAGRPLDVSHLERAYGDVRDTGADGTRAREELGFEPATGLEEGLAAELEWLREEIEGRVPPRASLGQAPSDQS
jgi:nucleoside-diphosphate-sugar epimerase